MATLSGGKAETELKNKAAVIIQSERAKKRKKRRFDGAIGRRENIESPNGGVFC